MKNLRTILLLSLITMALGSYAQDTNFPRLEKEKNRTQLIVDGKPFLMLAGELHNSSGGSAYWLNPIWKRMAAKNLNTVIASVSWELLEPEEGKYDFALVDSTILGARKEGLKLVLIWFGSWKNAESTYVPAWVKKDSKRFQRAKTKNGITLNMLSALSENAMKADAKAFTALMNHIKEIDSKDHTVVMMQIENEIGTYNMRNFITGGENAVMRDYCELANKAFEQQVPSDLIAYLKKHKNELHPALLKVWKEHGMKEKGTWEEVFGQGQPYKGPDWQNEFPYYTEEIFNAWNYARYMGEVARQGKEVYPLPMYVNMWMKSKNAPEPGTYPSGAAHPHVFDIWRAGASAIDLYAPDIYLPEIFDWICTTYKRGGNPLFIPEIRPEPNSAARAFYAYGKYDAMCYAPFGVDGNWYFNNIEPEDNSFDLAYGCLKPLIPLILQNQGTGKMNGLYIESDKNDDRIDMGKYTILIRRASFKGGAALFGGDVKEAAQSKYACGALVIQTGEDEFIVAGGIGGMSIIVMKNDKNKAANVAYESVDEIFYDKDGNEIAHRLNGDEASFSAATVLPGKVGVYRIKMFEY